MKLFFLLVALRCVALRYVETSFPGKYDDGTFRIFITLGRIENDVCDGIGEKITGIYDE